MTLMALDDELDVYEWTEEPGGAVASTEDPFDPYRADRWWTRRRAGVPAYGEPVRGRLRDYLFGDRKGEFHLWMMERGLLAPLGRPDTDFERRWLLREPSSDACWLVDFAPKVLDAPLAHIECYARRLDPSPVNHD